MFSAENRPTLNLLQLAFCGMVLACVIAYPMFNMPNTAPLRWLLGSGIIGGWHIWFTYQRLDSNRPAPAEKRFPTLGAANAMSITRGLFNALVAGFILAPLPHSYIWLPVILWTLSGFLDMFDGVVARMTKRQSQLGETLDLEFDAAAILIICVYTVAQDLMPVWYIGLGIARYLFIAGLNWREKRNLPIAEMTESNQRRLEAGIQMAFMAVMLWPIVGKPLTTVAAYGFGVPFGLLFLRDWLVVSTWLDPLDKRYLALRRALRTVMYQLLPFFGRILLAGLVLTGLLPVNVTTPLGWVTLITALMVFLGVISRLSAIFFLIPIVFSGLPLPWSAILLIPTIAIIKFGGGPFCLWLPEERFFSARLGESS